MLKDQSNKIISKVLKLVSIPAIIGILLGAVGGWVYYIEIGCASGTCPLTSNPYTSILWGAVVGYLFGDMFTKKNRVKEETVEEDSIGKEQG